MVQGHQGAARLHGGTQAGLVREGTLPQPDGGRKARLPLAELRAALQRAAFPEPSLLPVPDQDDQGADADAEQLLVAVPGLYHPQGSEPRHGGTFFGCRRAVRPHRERHGAGQAAPSAGRGGLSGGHRNDGKKYVNILSL